MKNRTQHGRHMIMSGMIAVSLLLTSCAMGSTSYKVDQLEEVSSSAESEGTAAADAAVADSAIGDAGKGTAGKEGQNIGKEASGKTGQQAEKDEPSPTPTMPPKEKLNFDLSWEFAEESKIHTDPVTLWHAREPGRKNIIVAVNAGHGCKGGESEQTYCHPDHTAKVTGGSTSAGATTATAINSGMTFDDGTKEAEAVLQLAGLVKEELLKAGFDVLMIRDNDDTQLDNIARTVFANNCADCHISLHYDSTAGNKGFFYIRVPDNASYKAMEPVASNWERHDALGEAVLKGVSENGVEIFGSGSIALDLTQTSYSTVPSVDLEVGDKSSDHSEMAQKPVAEGIAAGIEKYFRENPVKDGALAKLMKQSTGALSGSAEAADETMETEIETDMETQNEKTEESESIEK